MILSPRQARAVIAGRVTQARVPATGKVLKVGHDYPVSTARGRPSICRVTILGARLTAAGDLTHGDARAEGFRSADELRAAWVRRYDREWLQRERVDLAAVFDDGVSVVDWILRRRFEQRHAHRPVRVVQFVVVTDEPLYLATQRDVLTARSSDYTANRQRAADTLEVTPLYWLEREAARARAEGEANRDRHRAEWLAERKRVRSERSLRRARLAR